MNEQQLGEGRDRDIRGVMIAVTGGRVLLPNASIAEVITFADPEPVPNAPAWLLGRVRWRGWRLPLISFARLAGYAAEEGELGAKVAVLKALGGSAKMPYFALLTQGFPRLTTVSRDALMESAPDVERRPGVLVDVLLRDDAAAIPDLAAIEEAIAQALADAEAAVA